MNSIFEWISMRRDYVQKRISSDYNKCFSIYVQSKKKPHFRCISRTEIDLSEKDLYLLYALLCIMCTVHLQCILQSTIL